MKSNSFLIVLLMTSLSPVYLWADITPERRNPFYLPQEKQGIMTEHVKEPPKEEPLRLSLEATFVSDQEKYALINGYIVHVGDILDKGVKVAAIQKNKVILSKNEQVYTLYLPFLSGELEPKKYEK